MAKVYHLILCFQHYPSLVNMVYLHKNPKTKEIFYIGLGRFNRCNQITKRNKYWTHYAAKHGVLIEIAFENLIKDEAISIEKKMIRKFSPRCNLTLGGEVSTRIAKPVYAFDTKGKLVAQYHCVTDANVSLGLTERDSRIYRCLKGVRIKAHGYIWSNQPSFPGFRKRKIWNPKAVYQYDLMGRFLKSYSNISCVPVSCRTGINYAIDKMKTYQGYFWRTEKFETIQVSVPVPALKQKKKVRCCKTGEVYDSVAKAANAFGIRNQTLSKKLRGAITNNTTLSFYE